MNQWKNFNWDEVPFEMLSAKKKRQFLFKEANYSCSECGYNKRRNCGVRSSTVEHSTVARKTRVQHPSDTLTALM